MPYEDFGKRATYLLNETHKEFSIDQYGWHCKLAFEGSSAYFETKKYLLWINNTLVTDLEKAPPI